MPVLPQGHLLPSPAIFTGASIITQRDEEFIMDLGPWWNVQ